MSQSHIIYVVVDGVANSNIALEKIVLKPTLRSKIEKIIQKPNSDLLSLEEFCNLAAIPYEENKGYVRAERSRRKKVRFHHAFPHGEVFDTETQRFRRSGFRKLGRGKS